MCVRLNAETNLWNIAAFVKLFEYEGPIFEVGGRIRQLVITIALFARPATPGYLSTKPRFLRSGRADGPGGPGYLCPVLPSRPL